MHNICVVKVRYVKSVLSDRLHNAIICRVYECSYFKSELCVFSASLWNMGGAFFLWKKTNKKGKNMKIKTELLKRYIADYVINQFEDFEIDAHSVANSVAIKVLSRIQEIIKDDELDDFMKVDEIVCVFEEYKIDFGGCHDFY